MTILEKRLILLSAFVPVCFFSTPAMAEVMDKEMSITTVWAWAICGVILGLFFIRCQWWLGFLTLSIFGFILYGPISEWNDPFVGSAIVAEAGGNYGMNAYFAASFLIMTHFIGWIFSYLKGRDSTSADSKKPCR